MKILLFYQLVCTNDTPKLNVCVFEVTKCDFTASCWLNDPLVLEGYTTSVIPWWFDMNLSRSSRRTLYELPNLT